MSYLRANPPWPAWTSVSESILRGQGVIPQQGDSDRLAEALDAAYHYELFLLGTDASYDFAANKHRGDWIDSQMLYYLSDPDMYLLTNDAAVKSRCEPSPQAERIIVI
jgi:hypothetical protein